ncbi:Carboxylesterase NlhH [Thalassoglobus neptunius]|uniref:Carboxylesterase NlhH n=1 Tax=Thalassoglobus neptunius TaxID=1938619 RepID=A0A5C5X5K1_9PLAN|nr:alpha/beta hydrolase [Thalassoglobus neptunius]TWT58306.1 Carboxylesterase NlhH [Thalassoglobus neptunius]
MRFFQNQSLVSFNIRMGLIAAALFVAAPALLFADDDEIRYRTEKEIFYRDSEGASELERERCKLDIYFPENLKNFPTVVWFHGGGLKGGNRFIPSELKDQGIAVVAVNYRLYPKVKAPAYIEDAAAAVAWVFENIADYGGSPEKIFVSGHSAGGYLTSMIGLDKSWLEAHQIDADDIAGLIPFSGHTITHMTVREERGIPQQQPIVDDLAPLYHVRADAPPLLLITGDRELEMLGRYEENAYMWRMMQVAGHQQTTLFELDGYNHGGMAHPAHPLMLKFIRRITQAE